jgi:hypothetical protein
MFIIRKKKNNSGMILFLVIVFLLVSAILLAGLFSRNISASLVAIEHERQTKAEVLARGLYWKAYSQKFVSGANLGNGTETIDGIVYTYTFAYGAGSDITVTVNYP